MSNFKRNECWVLGSLCHEGRAERAHRGWGGEIQASEMPKAAPSATHGPKHMPSPETAQLLSRNSPDHACPMAKCSSTPITVCLETNSAAFPQTPTPFWFPFF